MIIRRYKEPFSESDPNPKNAHHPKPLEEQMFVQFHYIIWTNTDSVDIQLSKQTPNIKQVTKYSYSQQTNKTKGEHARFNQFTDAYEPQNAKN